MSYELTAAYDTRDKLIARLESTERQAARLAERLAMLDSLPEEPSFEDPNEPVVIQFSRTFNRGSSKRYDYAAIKAGDGLWYTTGPRTPKGYTWENLVQWIYEFGPVDIWLVATFESL